MSPIKIDNLCPELDDLGYIVAAEFKNDTTRICVLEKFTGERWFISCEGEDAFRRALVEFATSIGISVEWSGTVYHPV